MRRHLITIFFCFYVFLQAAVMAYEFNPGVSLSVTEEYNDNIDLTKTNNKDDFITYLSPSLSLAFKSQSADLRAGYSPSFSYYPSNEDLNSTSHTASLNGTFAVSDKIGLTLNDTFVKSRDLRYLIAVSDLGPIRRRADRLANTAGGAVSYKFSNKIAAVAGASFTDVSYNERGFNDVKSSSGSLGITYTANARTSLSAAGRYTGYDYSLTSDAHSREFDIGVTHRLTPTLTLGLSGGAVTTELDAANKSTTDFSGGIELTRRLEKGTAILSFRQTVVPGLEDATPLRSQAVGLRLSRPLANSWTVSLSPTYTKFKSLGGVASDTEVVGVTADLTYNLRRWAGLTLSYGFYRNYDNANRAGDYTNNRIALTFRIQYERRQAQPQRETQPQQPVPQQPIQQSIPPQLIQQPAPQQPTQEEPVPRQPFQQSPQEPGAPQR